MMKEIAIDILFAVFMAFAMGAVYRGVFYMKKYADAYMQEVKQSEIYKKNEVVRSSFDFACSVVDGLITTAVVAMEQTKAELLRERVRKGVSDRAELIALGVEVRESIKESINQSTKDALEIYIANIDKFIDDKVESTVYALKEGLLESK